MSVDQYKTYSFYPETNLYQEPAPTRLEIFICCQQMFNVCNPNYLYFKTIYQTEIQLK